MNGGLSRDKDTHFTVIDERDKAEDKGLTEFPTVIPHIAPRSARMETRKRHEG